VRPLPKKEKQKKKSWKEKQRDKNVKFQKAQEAYETQREKVAEKKPRSLSTRKLLGATGLILLLFLAYVAWQYTQPSTAPPAINPSNPLQTLYEFTMSDINGTQFSLRNFSSRVILIHVMGVGCSGQINEVNINQLTQLKAVCSIYCENAPITFITVAVATCATSNLEQIRSNYKISWLFGNDFADGIMDIAQKYGTHGDGTIVLIDKTFHISDSYGAASASEIIGGIDQILGA